MPAAAPTPFSSRRGRSLGPSRGLRRGPMIRSGADGERQVREYDGRVEADAAAVARVADGDADALRQLYERYGRIVYGLTYRLTRDAQLAEEATQDTFVTLWKRAHTYDPQRAKVTTWLFVIARNRAIELVRSRARVPEPRESVEPTGEEANPADLMQIADDAERIALA